MTVTANPTRWRPVCAATDLPKGQVRPLHLSGTAVALFRTCEGEWYALADLDPHATPDERDGALSAGRLAYRRDVPVVVAAGSGRRFELARGVCLDGDGVVAAFPVRVVGGAVEIAVPAA